MEIKIKAVLDGTECCLDDLINKYNMKIGDMAISMADTTYNFTCSYDGTTNVELEALKGDIIIYIRNASHYCPGHKGYHTGIPMWKNIGPLSGSIGATGDVGATGANGKDGIDGKDGAQGPTGPAGLSAYEVWKTIPGNEDKAKTEFIASLKGITGETGATGATGPQGDPGATFNIIASYDTFEQLANEQPYGARGEANLVNGYIYIYNPQYETGAEEDPEILWINTGVKFEAVDGKDGLTTAINLKGKLYEHIDGIITIDKVDADTINGKKIVALTQAEYNNLDLTNKLDENTIYILTDISGSSIGSSTNAKNADMVDGKHLWTGTQAEYDKLVNKSEDTIYIITDAVADVPSTEIGLPTGAFPGAVLSVDNNGNLVWTNMPLEDITLITTLNKVYEVGTQLTNVQLLLEGNEKTLSNITEYSVTINSNGIQTVTEKIPYDGKILVNELNFTDESQIEIFVTLTIDNADVKTNSIYLRGARAAFYGSLYIDEEYLYNMTDTELVNNSLVYPRILSGCLLDPKGGDMVRISTNKGDNVICIAYPLNSISELQSVYSEASGDEFIDAFNSFNSRYNEYTGEQEQILVPGAFGNGESIPYKIHILTHKDGFGSNSFVIRF